MIIVRLIGGLGNQLFQYATARNLSFIHRTPLKLDISFYENNTNRYYRLDKLCIKERFATREEIDEINGSKKKGVGRVLYRLEEITMPYYRRSVYKENTLKPFDSRLFRTPESLYLDGYWQSEKYFLDIRNILLSEYTAKRDIKVNNIDLINQVASGSSISIHVRRGDYLSNPEAIKVHGVCSVDYYRQCINYIESKVTHPRYFVFSDDPTWAAEHLAFAKPSVFIGTNEIRDDVEDLLIMSLCTHNIIANSSYSWWGAWLNQKPDKIVLAPRQWFKDNALDTRDLIPETWIRI